MKFVLSFIFILFLFSSDKFLFAQSNIIKLKRVNPNGWFSLLVPQNNAGFLRHGSVDGGDIDSKEIQVEFHYWQYKNTPLFVKNEGNISVCSNRLHSKSWINNVDGRKVTSQTCFDNRSSEFIYYLTFPKLKVPDEESGKFRYGEFYLTITYKGKSHLPLVQRIAKSLKFKS